VTPGAVIITRVIDRITPGSPGAMLQALMVSGL
jgi:hypothetical protein